MKHLVLCGTLVLGILRRVELLELHLCNLLLFRLRLVVDEGFVLVMMRGRYTRSSCTTPLLFVFVHKLVSLLEVEKLLIRR